MEIGNNRRKRIENKQEERTHEILNDIAKEYEARIFTKTRVADVLEIGNTGLSDNEYKYALMAHFDFVVTDNDYMPKFAVEFDGSQHKSDASAIRRDELKNNICRKFGFPLLRITSEYFEKIGKFPTILSWITELYFLQELFYAAQDKGEIPQDEPWMWFNVIGYDPVVRYRAFIRNAYGRGLCCDEVIKYICGRSKGSKSYATLSTLKLSNDKYIASLVECLSIRYFPITAHDISKEISDYNIYKKFKKYLEGNNIHTYAYDEILKMQRDFIKQHDLCSYNIQLIE
ncbi:DUF2726 domain-containing protein [Methanosarcina sp. 2.H.A.1B.4]|uniref:DUF2726 domain-containing protein n=1 Tax=Methanosarcina sp. 2.H.A.1B.4 TaxID=1483600 RepID=UPI0006222ADC|nr:DUF2726 domain-containing protein [Methanosarcina sp. 2.H.A.1B.4]KKG08763.1 hypothetical protein EO92_13120 [Methanosarcina sp. 2.H.A.1B.4]